MFYCNLCAEDLDYPITMFKSRGLCEICGTMAICNERPSHLLPNLRQRDKDTKQDPSTFLG